MLQTIAAAMLTNPVSLSVEAPEEALRPGEESEIRLVLSVESPWYIYAPTGVNKGQGMAETAVRMRQSEAVQYKSAIFPEALSYGGFDVLLGESIVLRQPLRIRTAVKPGETRVRGNVDYQVCKPDLCLPPDTFRFAVELLVER